MEREQHHIGTAVSVSRTHKAYLKSKSKTRQNSSQQNSAFTTPVMSPTRLLSPAYKKPPVIRNSLSKPPTANTKVQQIVVEDVSGTTRLPYIRDLKRIDAFSPCVWNA